MRTTIVLEEKIEKLVSPLASQKKLSQFINQCLMEHFENEAKKRLRQELSSAYQRANEEGKQLTEEFESIDVEGLVRTPDMNIVSC